MQGAAERREVLRIGRGGASRHLDEVVVEEPLELRLVCGEEERAFGLTMRTPGADEELVLGLLHAESAISSRADVLRLEVWREGDAEQPNVMRVALRSGFAALSRLSRASLTSSACGVCGTGSIEMLALRARPPLWTAPPIAPELICALPERLLAAQALFERTGGLHGAGLFDAAGTLLVAREDVGRHNAADKVIGWALQRDLVPLSNHILAVSSRLGFEIVQKAVLGGIAVVCAVSAPSSLAVEVAEDFGLTLIGFVRGERFNVYAGEERLALEVRAVSP